MSTSARNQHLFRLWDKARHRINQSTFTNNLAAVFSRRKIPPRKRKALNVACKLDNTMLSYKDFTGHFGLSLFDGIFQTFLKRTFSDLTEYNILESDYISSTDAAIDLGFKNNNAVYDENENEVFEDGNPIFSHFIFWPKSLTLVNILPFDAHFYNNRTQIINKAGKPTQTKEGYADFLNKAFRVDNYKVGNIVITFDYDQEDQTINFIQARDNNLAEHLKL